jgi:hypothetical protein
MLPTLPCLKSQFADLQTISNFFSGGTRFADPCAAMVIGHEDRQMGRPESCPQVEGLIFVLRGLRVVLDYDLAALYGVPTKRFNEQVRRNQARFPDDFMFKLTRAEHENLRSQIATSSRLHHGGRRYLPTAFTEHGAIMAATVLNSPKAVAMSIVVVRAFIRLRAMLATHQQLASKLMELEQKLTTHDDHIAVLFEAIKQLMAEPFPHGRQIGFRADYD